MEENLLRYFGQLRGEYFSIGDLTSGRMPMAYVQTMEVLVDTLTFLAPLALYVKMGTFNIISTGLLTVFFKGLLELSKSFLDPFGREGYRAHNIRVDVLVSEMNFGASSRWVNAGDALPSELLQRNEPGSSVPGQPAAMQSEEGSFTEGAAQDYDFLRKDDKNADDTSPEIRYDLSKVSDVSLLRGPNEKSAGDVNGSGS